MRTPKSASFLLLAAALAWLPLGGEARAQRGTAKLSWQKRTAQIEHGIPRLGQHSLESLVPGTLWRMGSNIATTLTTEMPLLSGQTVIPPGSYRIQIQRQTEMKFVFLVEGAGFKMGGRGNDAMVPAKLDEVKKNAERLDIQWKAKSKSKQKGESQASDLRVHFGNHELSANLTALGTTSKKLKGFSVDVYTWPAAELLERLDHDDAIPVARLTKKGKKDKKAPPFWNLLVFSNKAILLPAQVAPTDSFGFGAVQPPAAEYTRQGQATWSPGQEETRTLEIETLEWTKEKEIHLVAHCGEKTVEILLADPSRRQKATR